MSCKVVARENESLDDLLRRFRRRTNEANILGEIKKHEFYLSKAQRRRAKQKEAAAKRRKISRMIKNSSGNNNN